MTIQAVPSSPARAPRPRTSLAAPEVRKRLRRRQRELVESYRAEPERACVTDHARTRAENALADGPLDPLHTWLEVGEDHDVTVPIALHTALGGLGDLPVPGDLLCAALAACTDSTLRVLANTFGVHLQRLHVDVEASVDVRGALCLSPDAPVAFKNMRVRIDMRAAPGTDPGRLDRMATAAEHCCVVLRSLREGIPVDVEFAHGTTHD